MKYLVVQDWPITHGNHAGMVHMAEMLVQNYPGYKVVCRPYTPKREGMSRVLQIMSDLLGRIVRIFSLKLWIKFFMPYAYTMINNIKRGDVVFLLQYNAEGCMQNYIAKYIKSIDKDIPIYAMSHLTKSKYIEIGFDKRKVLEWDRWIDKHIPMGSSLSDYFIECGVPESKISVGFHYVDNEFYHKDDSDITTCKKATVIAIGAMQRDYSLLADIVRSTPTVNWIICKGNKDVGDLFDYHNVKLVGYVPELELKELMSQADVSINVMEDTVGSNVITTSLAMGLVVVVSDVGSIRDYVDESCAYFCNNNVVSFANAINKLSKDSQMLKEKRLNALLRSKKFTIDKVHFWFSTLQ